MALYRKWLSPKWWCEIVVHWVETSEWQSFLTWKFFWELTWLNFKCIQFAPNFESVFFFKKDMPDWERKNHLKHLQSGIPGKRDELAWSYPSGERNWTFNWKIIFTSTWFSLLKFLLWLKGSTTTSGASPVGKLLKVKDGIHHRVIWFSFLKLEKFSIMFLFQCLLYIFSSSFRGR